MRPQASGQSKGQMERACATVSWGTSCTACGSIQNEVYLLRRSGGEGYGSAPLPKGAHSPATADTWGEFAGSALVDVPPGPVAGAYSKFAKDTVEVVVATPASSGISRLLLRNVKQSFARDVCGLVDRSSVCIADGPPMEEVVERMNSASAARARQRRARRSGSRRGSRPADWRRSRGPAARGARRVEARTRRRQKHQMDPIRDSKGFRNVPPARVQRQRGAFRGPAPTAARRNGC